MEKINATNANKDLGFDKFAECDYNKHWSFSNFNRMLIAAARIATLGKGAKVLEIGAGTSDLKRMVVENYKRHDIEFIRTDASKEYKLDENIDYIFDVTQKVQADCIVEGRGKFDCIVCMEVIEHIDKKEGMQVIQTMAEMLKKKGMLILTTPTPPLQGSFEDRVWPTDHDEEYIQAEIVSMVNDFFKVEKEFGWSLEEREYLRVLSEDPLAGHVYLKLKGVFPEEYIKSLIASLCDVKFARQIMVVGTVRSERVKRGNRLW